MKDRVSLRGVLDMGGQVNWKKTIQKWQLNPV